MRDRVDSILNDGRARRGADVALALALAAASVVDILVGKQAPSTWGGRGAAQILLALAVTLPLAWRSSYPIAVLTVTNVSATVIVILAAPHQPAFEPFVAIVLTAYSVGAHTVGRRVYAGLGLMLGLGVASVALAATAGVEPSSTAAPGVWLVAAWIVGRIINGRRRRTLELEALTKELDAQRDLQAQAAVAVERGRIARELHDIVAHNVSMMVVQAGAAASVLEGDQRHVREALAAIADTGRRTVDEMRTLLGVLRDNGHGPSLSPQPGLFDLEQLVQHARNAGLHVLLEIEGRRRPLPDALDLSAFRIAQEALTNTLKHAGPAQASVRVHYGDDAVELEVRDDGAGRRGDGGNGHGLIGIRERVAMLDGTLETGPCAGGGFLVRAVLPISRTRVA